jgi:hypothetical protein
MRSIMETLKFDDLEQYLLLKNGNLLYKIPYKDGYAVLKVYFGSSGTFRCMMKSANNWLLGQTSYMPLTRKVNEVRTLKLWRDVGLRVFGLYEDVKVEGQPEGGYMLFEYVEGVKFVDYFADPSVSLDDKIVMWRRYLAEAGKRHEAAMRDKEPALVHENGDLKHVLIMDDNDLLYFDFEMTYTHASKIRRYIAREILAFLKSLAKTVGPELFPRFIEETKAHYPHPDLLAECYTIMFKHPNLFRRVGRALERRFKPRAKKETSIHNVARYFG